MTDEEQQKDEGIEFLAADDKRREKLTPRRLKKLSGDLKFGASEGDGKR